MSVTPEPSRLAQARSFLFVPGNRPERFAKALASGVDAVIIDLEDAVPLDAKDTARAALMDAWKDFDAAERARLLVRVNPAGTPWHEADLAAVAILTGLGALMLPKAENPQQVEQAFRTSSKRVLPLIESAEGVGQMDAIARAAGTLRLGLGHIDLQADLGLRCGPDEAELAPVRLAMVVASRRAGLPAPVDGVTTATQDAEVLAADAQRSRRFGFGAKLCIHPAQVAGVHQALVPTDAERDWARRVLAAEVAAGGGAFSVDGKMVDPPVLLLARSLLRER
ncbi:HpcH/HpaI aldolase/citrate lyase family protein [Limnohabitans sp. 63ED37-2]|uniref:HpcH/HpaI aldolase/citrate lyase family protein n=1 Tax=Limnohabitans sp. 63ED37-2 TaxID=1678128 RepID=UPI0007064509|nr:CoA ester lyase [Limnohabitans sp. 63ED37-2]ALK90155.1 Citrate lyase subunit beta-like protein [Limnohabitans sp. 63ED37-2]